MVTSPKIKSSKSTKIEARNLAATVSPEAQGQRVDRWLANMFAQEAGPADQSSSERDQPLSRSRIKALMEQGNVSRDGGTITDPSLRVKSGETYQLLIPPPAESQPAGRDLAIDVVYEDRHLIVINKPAGMTVHPAPGHSDDTLVNALIHHCGASLSGIGGVRRPGIVHRIDKDTSGLIVVAKNDKAHHYLSALFAEHDLERAYLAFVWGVPSPLEGVIEGNIGRDPANRKRMSVRRSGGKAAVTNYKVQKILAEGAASLVECRLETGRTHQIRVHMTAIGHPLIGDPVYGKARAGLNRARKLPEASIQAIKGLGRQALHAALLAFRHPVGGRIMRFESELPPDLASLLASFAVKSP